MILPTLRVTLTLQCGQNIEEYKCSLYSLFDGYEKKNNNVSILEHIQELQKVHAQSC